MLSRPLMHQKRLDGVSVSSIFSKWVRTTTYPLGTSRHSTDNPYQAQQLRRFHATRRQEILPVLAAGAVLLIGRYSWKALTRMDDEWEDYQWQLQQYERQRLKDEAPDVPMTIGVDLGTVYLKLAALNAASRPELVATAQGARYRFTGILTNNDEPDNMVIGQPALDKFFYQPRVENPIDEPVVLPYRVLQTSSQADAAKLVQRVLLPTIGEALDRVATNVEASVERQVRTVLTLPPCFYNQHGETIFQNYHDDSHHTVSVPDPVAALWGAQALGLLPAPETKEIQNMLTLLVDIGGLTSTISLIKQDRVVASSTLDGIGGESYVEQLVYRLLKDAGDDTLANDPTSLALIHASARSSVMELVRKDQAKVHIPFLFTGRNPDKPHLDTTVSRAALEQAVQDDWGRRIVPRLLEESQLSSSLPFPSSAQMIIMSAVTKVLEESGQLPDGIEQILVVGGGSQHRLMEQATKEGVRAMLGAKIIDQRLVLPESSLRSELTALGAASLLPNFDYSYDNGLVRV